MSPRLRRHKRVADTYRVHTNRIRVTRKNDISSSMTCTGKRRQQVPKAHKLERPWAPSHGEALGEVTSAPAIFSTFASFSYFLQCLLMTHRDRAQLLHWAVGCVCRCKKKKGKKGDVGSGCGKVGTGKWDFTFPKEERYISFRVKHDHGKERRRETRLRWWTAAVIPDFFKACP